MTTKIDGTTGITFPDASIQSFSADQLTNPSGFYKADWNSHCFTKTGGGTLSINAGTRVILANNTDINFTVSTAITMPSLVAGSDYSVWVKPDGSAVAIVDPYNAPATAPVTNARKIGGFHYGLVTPGTTPAGGSFNTATSSPLVSMVWTQGLVDDIAGINKYSLWDLKFRPKSDARGMVFIANTFWCDVYFCGTDHITYGTSFYNSNIASGTVLPKIPVIFGGDGTTTYTTMTWYEASEIARAYGKRLIDYDEFSAAAFGVTENQSIGGASSTYPNTGRSAGYTSRYGIEQATGHHWSWGNVGHGVAGASWTAGANRGQIYGIPYGSLYGGSRDSAAYSGSRCSHWGGPTWYSVWPVGLRAACDHLQLV